MPKQRLTCTRCSQRRQKCDRKQPCTRCLRNGEAELCTTQWKEGYNPAVHRRYPKRPADTVRSLAFSTTSSSNPSPDSEAPVVLAAQSNSSESPIPNFPSETHNFNSLGHRVLDISIGALLNEKDGPGPTPSICDQSYKFVQPNGKLQDEPSRIVACLSPAAKAAELQHLQSILPDRDGLLRITDYYQQHMLYWNYGLYHGPTFRQEILRAYGIASTINVQTIDFKWLALLFSILSSAMIACPEAIASSWGHSVDNKVKLSRTWGAASVTCLVLGNYTSHYHIHSIHAILILHSYEHLIGSSNQWMALRSVAVVIAKGLGLHRLGPHPDDQRIHQLNEQEKKEFVNREIGRRTWTHIVTQDWVCSITQNSAYSVSIQKQHFTSTKPMVLDEDTMLPVDDTTPSISVAGRYFFEYVHTLLEFHNAMLPIPDSDETTKYATLLQFDGEFRAVCAEKVPKCLAPQTSLDPQWPKWATWNKRFHQASVHHKIIMLHQSFLSKSFRDARYTYTRWACVSSAKEIISVYQMREANEPQWWVEQAFVITSGACLLLDMFHRRTVDAEALEHYACVAKALWWLQQFPTSSVALHGTRLISSLLHEYKKLHPEAHSLLESKSSLSSATGAVEEQRLPVPLGRQAPVPISNAGVPAANDEMGAFNFDFDIDTIGFEDLMDYLPIADVGLDNATFLDGIIGLTMW